MKRLLSISFFAALLAAASTASTAMAGGPEVEKEGRCSQGSEWSLDLDREHGRIEAEFEVDDTAPGVRWRVTLRQRGKVVFNGKRTTRVRAGDDHGSFEVRRLLRNRRGPDRIRATAISPTGEVCRAAATARF